MTSCTIVGLSRSQLRCLPAAGANLPIRTSTMSPPLLRGRPLSEASSASLPAHTSRVAPMHAWVGAVVGLLVLVGTTTNALDNGLGLTPPMGYNAYDHVGCCANETTMKEEGQAFIDRGLFKLGYKHVNMVSWPHSKKECVCHVSTQWPHC